MSKSPAWLHHAVLKDDEWSLIASAVCFMASSRPYNTTIGQVMCH